MPALVKSNVGSCAGIRDELETFSWPFFIKNSKKRERISVDFIGVFLWLALKKTVQGGTLTLRYRLLLFESIMYDFFEFF
jgi:hypothetical protein